MNEYQIRKATLNDLDFIADAILFSDLGNSNLISFCTLFNLTKNEAKSILLEVLSEETDGCEWSLSSYFVVEYNEIPVATFGGWIESENDMPSSGLLKANLINMFFPIESKQFIRNHNEILNQFRHNREEGALILECAYCKPEHRGKRLVQKLIEHHIFEQKKSNSMPFKTQLQVFSNNEPAIKLYKRCGFEVVETIKSNHPNILEYFASDEKLIMEKN